MIERIRAGLFPLHRKKRPDKLRHSVLHGNAHNIIVVKAPNDIFTEAIFLMRDDYFLNPTAPEELLEQAKSAATDYTASVSVKDRWKKTLLIVLSALLVLETAGLLMLIS